MKITAEPASLGFDPERLSRIGEWAGRYVESGKLPCAYTVVARNGEVVFSDIRGFADVESNKPLKEDTLVRIFSMTKPMTSVAALILMEEGKLRLDDPVSRYLPDFAKVPVLAPPGGDLARTAELETPMTVHQLMTHTSGLTYGFLDPAATLGDVYQKHDIDMNPKGSTLTEWADDLAQIPLMFQPGSRWNYGVSTDLLGHIVEIIEQDDLAAVFRRRIFEPLGMTETSFEVSDSDLDRFASVYKFSTNGKFSLMESADKSVFRSPVKRWHGGGGLVSTARDYMRFALMMRARGIFDGSRILGPRTVDFMTSNHLPGDMEAMGQPTFGESNFRGIGFGLGVAVVIDPTRAELLTSAGDYFWGGAASTVFWVDPIQDLVVIFLTQLFPSSSYPLRQELRTLVNQALVDVY